MTSADLPAVRRLALVLVPPGISVGAPPPGIDRRTWSLALVEDCYEVLAGLAQARGGLAATAADLAVLAELTWPDSVLVDVGAASGGPVPRSSAVVSAADGAAGSADRLVLVAPDVPDLPALHVGKLFQALETADLAWCPVADGGVAALGVTLPLADWVRELTPGLDDEPADWVGAAPRRRDVGTGPGWHRLRTPADLRHLDPGLSGWESTRALLSGRPLGAAG